MKAGFAMPFIAMFVICAPVAAQDAPDPVANPSEHRLTPEQVEQVLAEAAAKRGEARRGADQARANVEELDLLPPVYGEVGVTIGTDGYRSAYGSATYPLGHSGSASILLNFDNWKHEQPWDWGNRPPNR